MPLQDVGIWHRRPARLMGVGTNRINIYTVRMAAQALANYIGQQTGSGHRVIIGYDCRHHSKEFAEEAAKVLSANGIHPLLFNALRPCPSFPLDAAI